MSVYSLPEIGKRGRLTLVDPTERPEDDEEKLYWIGSATPARGYKRGTEVLLEEYRQDVSNAGEDGPIYFHHYLSEAGLDMIQESLLQIELGYYASQGLSWWPNDLEKRRLNVVMGDNNDKRILWNTNVISILESVPDVSRRGVPSSSFPTIIRDIKTKVGGEALASLGELLVSLIEGGMQNERVQYFTEVLIEQLN